MSIIGEGFAIRRNGSCFEDVEVDCGATRAPFRGCCPNNYACPSQYNIACCESGFNCTTSLLEVSPPRCANETWNLFDNGGYFCCEQGLTAYNRDNTNVCASPGARILAGDKLLPLMRSGIPYSETSTPASSSLPVTLSFSSLASPTASATAATTPTSGSTSPSNTSAPPNSDSNSNSSSSSSSSTNVGAIAGGVVGGVVGLALIAFLAWFFLRRRKNAAENNPYLLQERHEVDGASSAVSTKYRMDAQPNYYHEADGQNVYRNELQAQQKPVELPAGKN